MTLKSWPDGFIYLFLKLLMSFSMLRLEISFWRLDKVMQLCVIMCEKPV